MTTTSGPQAVSYQDSSLPIVDTKTGVASPYFDTLIRSLIARTGGADDLIYAANLLAGQAVPQGTEVIAGGGLQVGGALGGNVGLALYVIIGPVAGLPAAAEGDLAYATNGLKPGESSGAGTGVVVFYSHSNWISVCSGAAEED